MPQVNAGQRVTAGLLSEDYGLGDPSTFTVTQATANDLSKAWSIPANDAAAGVAYRLTVRGNGVWGATAQTLALTVVHGGASRGTMPTIGSTEFSTSAAIRWSLIITLMCMTAGSSGTWQIDLTGNASQTANNVLAGIGSQGSIGFAGGSSTTFTVDSTAAQTLKLQAAWGATTGAPTISSTYSIFERVGG